MTVSAAEEVDVFVFQTLLRRHSPLLFHLKASEAEVVVAEVLELEEEVSMRVVVVVVEVAR